MRRILIKILLILSIRNGKCFVSNDNIFNKIDLEKIRGGRIVGGEDADISQFPHQASLHFFGTHICGASLISNRWLITAAHCTTLDYAFVHTPIAGFAVRLGTSILEQGGQLIAVAKVIDHPLYLTNESTPYGHDMSLLYTSREVTFGPTIQPIRLPEANEVFMPGTRCTTIGWGYESEFASWLPEVLKKVDVPLLSSESCQSMYRTWETNSRIIITDTMICAGFTNGGRDSCGGDSGGPLIANNVLVGVTSWAIGCARENAPGVYSDVRYFREWIRENSGV